MIFFFICENFINFMKGLQNLKITRLKMIF